MDEFDGRPRRPGRNAHMATSDAIIEELLISPGTAKTVSELANVALEVRGVSKYQMAYAAVAALGRYGIVQYDEESDTVLIT
ncbi:MULTISPECIES: hypothetical protein [Tsukamurella]|uniref:MarR family transcriptional regulator n=1 Tax=Tsukamurella asaccharolytica TaxID=2592067 RepID=A0A5C5R4U8_9ACTN|nr:MULTISPECIES: hypothetical protein [Tsukamurella]TWS17762.1 hypothetical protein FK529_18895 [Tsukamurella asaccharolytica]